MKRTRYGGKGIRLGSGESFSCDRCDKGIRHRLCEDHLDAERSEYFDKGRQFERKQVTQPNFTPMISKEIDEFSGHVRNSKCEKCGLLANFDLEERNHQCV